MSVHVDCKLYSMLKMGSNGKGSNLVSLKLEVIAISVDPELVVDAMRCYPSVEELNTQDCTLEGLESFGSIIGKLELPSSVGCDSHRPHKVNYQGYNSLRHRGVIECNKTWCGTY